MLGLSVCPRWALTSDSLDLETSFSASMQGAVARPKAAEGHQAPLSGGTKMMYFRRRVANPEGARMSEVGPGEGCPLPAD